MSIELTTYLTGRDVTPTEDALVYEFATSGDGILYGCDVSVEGDNTIFVASGHGIFRGRKFTVQEEVIPVALPTSGNKSMRLIIHMDLSNANKPIEFINQEATIPLVQDDDINIINGIYELELATYVVTSTAIIGFSQTFKKLERGGSGSNIAISDVTGLTESLEKKADSKQAQLFKLTKDDGYSKKPSVNSWDNVTEPGNYYGEGLSNAITPSVGRMHCIVTSPKRGSVMQLGSDATNNTFGIRTQDGGTWNAWRILGSGGSGEGVRVYPVPFYMGAKASKYATDKDNKIIVKDGLATIRIRGDFSKIRGDGVSVVVIPTELAPKEEKGGVTGYGHDRIDAPYSSTVVPLKFVRKGTKLLALDLERDTSLLRKSDVYAYGSWEVK